MTDSQQDILKKFLDNLSDDLKPMFLGLEENLQLIVVQNAIFPGKAQKDLYQNDFITMVLVFYAGMGYYCAVNQVKSQPDKFVVCFIEGSNGYDRQDNLNRFKRYTMSDLEVKTFKDALENALERAS